MVEPRIGDFIEADQIVKALNEGTGTLQQKAIYLSNGLKVADVDFDGEFDVYKLTPWARETLRVNGRLPWRKVT